MSESSSRTMYITIVIFVVSIPISMFVLPGFVGLTGPPDAYTALLTGLSFFNAISFAAGLSFAIFGLQRVREVQNSSSLAVYAIYFSLSWQLISWSMHDNFHIASDISNNDIFYAGLLNIELVFHVTIQTAAIIAAFQVLKLMNTEFSVEESTTFKLGVEMPEKRFMLILTLILATVSFILLSQGALGLIPVWYADPPDNLFLIFVLLEIFDDITFGIGVSFIIVAFSKLKTTAPPVQSTLVALIVSLGWVMSAALVHVKLHLAVAPTDLLNIIYIDYSFHSTLIISALIAARSFYKLMGNELKAN